MYVPMYCLHQANEVGYVSVDGRRVWHTRFSARQGKQVCGLGPVGPQPRWSEIKDQQRIVGPLTISHSARSLRLRVGTIRGLEEANVKFFGINNLSLSTPSPCLHGRCQQQCGEKTCEPYTCDCDVGYKGTNCTDPQTHAWAIIPYMKGMGNQHIQHTATAKPGVRVCAPFAEAHAVRCCSDQHVSGYDQGIMYNFQKCKTWGEGQFTSSDGACPRALATSGCTTTRLETGAAAYCVRGATFNQTAEICRGHGVRVCSAEEISMGCVAKVGCEDDHLLVWSGDYCHV
eukprot:COSAG05_NODE_1671_length_4303_cov_2.550666_5_plen_287_part_00